jgi:hypothetical protein
VVQPVIKLAIIEGSRTLLCFNRGMTFSIKVNLSRLLIIPWMQISDRDRIDIDGDDKNKIWILGYKIVFIIVKSSFSNIFL